MEPVLHRRTKLKGHFNPEDFETRQEFAVSADGTRVPMFIVQRAGTLNDGTNPTLLYGYGGASQAPPRLLPVVSNAVQGLSVTLVEASEGLVDNPFSRAQ